MYNVSLQFSNNVGGSVLICEECNIHISGRLVSSFFFVANEDFMFYDTHRVLVFEGTLFLIPFMIQVYIAFKNLHT